MPIRDWGERALAACVGLQISRFMSCEVTAVTPSPSLRFARSLRSAAFVAAVVAAGCATPPGQQQIRETNAATDLADYRARAPAPDRPLTLEDALDYAARHNIEVWIAAQEREFQHELATQSLLKMLPSLAMGGQSSRRSRYDAASSQSLDTRQQSLEPSFSAEKDICTWDTVATWSLLDFGISFLRSRQQANRESIALQREYRVRQKLELEVTRVWWQAVVARESALEAARVAADVSAVLENIRKEIAEKTISEIDGLRRETRLLEQQEELRRYRRAYLAAKVELASLIGLEPGTPFALAYVDLGQGQTPLPETPLMTFEVGELEREALRSRPELFEKDLEEAISRDEVHIALAQMFPNLSAFWGYNFDFNRYLAFEEWNSAGLRVSWDLLTIPQQIKQREAVKLQTALIAKRRTAIAVAVLTQLHLALIDFDEAVGEQEITRTIADKHCTLSAAIESAAEDGKAHRGESLDQRMKYLKARARHLTAYSNVMIARARVLNTVGRTLGLGSDAAAESEQPNKPGRPPESAEEAPTSEET